MGAGYELTSGTKRNVEFFFTYNGKRLPAVPHVRLPYDDNNVSGYGLGADNTTGIDKLKYGTNDDQMQTSRCVAR